MASVEKAVNAILKEIRNTFNGLEDEAVQEFHNIMIPRVRAFGDARFKEGQTASQEGGAENAKQPRPKRVTNYTMFGNSFREQHPEIEAKEMFKNIGLEWKSLSDEEKAEWKTKADEQNRVYEAEYIEKYGSLPQKTKVRRRARTTNAFQQYVADFRKENPEVNHREVFTQAAAKWKKMTKAKKAPYEKQAETLKAQYREEFERMKEENPQLFEQMGGKRGKKKEPRPSLRTGYLLFGIHWRAKLNKDNLTGKEAMTAIGAAWKKQTKAAQAKYKKTADGENETEIQRFLKESPEAKWSVNYRKRQEKAAASS